MGAFDLFLLIIHAQYKSSSFTLSYTDCSGQLLVSDRHWADKLEYTTLVSSILV